MIITVLELQELLLLSRFSSVWLCVTPYTAAHQAPPSPGFSRQEHWSGLPFPSPMHEREKWKWSRSVVSDSQWPHGLQPTRLLCPWDFPGKSTGVGCHRLLRVTRESPPNCNLRSHLSGGQTTQDPLPAGTPSCCKQGSFQHCSSLSVGCPNSVLYMLLLLLFLLLFF